MLPIYNDLSFRPPRPMGIPWLRRRGVRSENGIPRVLVETPAPPVLREERIGNEMPAGLVLRPLVSFQRAQESKRVASSQLLRTIGCGSRRQIRTGDYWSADLNY